jgi:hypothetical protein
MSLMLFSTAAVAVLPWLSMPAAGQPAPSKAAVEPVNSSALPRTADGKPDLSGFWNIPYVPNMAMGKEADVPYTPAGLAAFKNHDSKDDPTGLCFAPGVPRIMQSPFPMLVMQTPGYIGMLFEYQRIWRLIYTDGRGHHEDAGATFMGDSIGKWDGDTLVIETTDFNDRTWLDTAGHQHTANMRVIERYTRTGPETLAFEISVEDPAYYSRPWKVQRVMKALKPIPKLPNLLEYFCTDNNLDVQHLISTKPAADSH